MSFEAGGRRSEVRSQKSDSAFQPPTSDLWLLTSDFHSSPAPRYAPYMFENVKASVALAAQKLTHLRRFL
jgi:hypothetical protein